MGNAIHNGRTNIDHVFKFIRNDSNSRNLNVNGSSTPQKFYYQNNAKETVLERANILIQDNGIEKNKFAGLDVLTNGLEIKVTNSSDIELYDLNKDESETNNLAIEHPQIVNEMAEIFEKSRTETPGFPYGGVVQDYKAQDRYNFNNE